MTINLDHLRDNIRVVNGLCRSHALDVLGITKAVAGDPVIAKVFMDGGITKLGDSRIHNIKKMRTLPAEKWLIRMPMLSEVEEVVRYCDASLHSELVTVRALGAEAVRQGRKHKVVLMVDLGDLREGYIDHGELLEAAAECAKTDGIVLHGIGVNLNCFSFVQPDAKKMRMLSHLAARINRRLPKPLEVVSGGNSSTIDLMLRGGVNGAVNTLRLGESLLFGRERAKYRYLPGTHRDVFTIDCEIIEVKDKPTLPWGVVGRDSYGNVPVFQNRGVRRQAICALGKQDFDLESTQPVDPGIKLRGASSDHLMADVTDAQSPCRVGDTITLQLGYFATMRAFTSVYVKKRYVGLGE